jgi:hypothetical protein
MLVIPKYFVLGRPSKTARFGPWVNQQTGELESSSTSYDMAQKALRRFGWGNFYVAKRIDISEPQLPPINE